jgi:hypothetical protein
MRVWQEIITLTRYLVDGRSEPRLAMVCHSIRDQHGA